MRLTRKSIYIGSWAIKEIESFLKSNHTAVHGVGVAFALLSREALFLKMYIFCLCWSISSFLVVFKSSCRTTTKEIVSNIVIIAPWLEYVLDWVSQLCMMCKCFSVKHEWHSNRSQKNPNRVIRVPFDLTRMVLKDPRPNMTLPNSLQRKQNAYNSPRVHVRAL